MKGAKERERVRSERSEGITEGGIVKGAKEIGK